MTNDAIHTMLAAVDAAERILSGTSVDVMDARLVLEDEQSTEATRISVIKRALLTPDQRQALTDADLVVGDLMTGRYTGNQAPLVLAMFDDWNTRMGAQLFSGLR